MLDNLKNKLSKLKKSDNSIVKKLDKIKKIEPDASQTYNSTQTNGPNSPNALAAQMEQIQKQTLEKIDEMVRAKFETVNTNAESINGIKAKIAKIDAAISGTRQSVEGFEERFNKMEETILELLSLYEVVSNSVNPFVGDNDNKSINNKALETIEKRMNDMNLSFEQLSNKMSSIDTSVSDKTLQKVQVEFDKKSKDLDMKFEQLYSSIQANEEKIAKFESELPKPADSIPVYEAGAAQLSSTPQMISTAQDDSELYQIALLEDIRNDSKSSIILLNWVEFLMEKVGKNNLMDVLDYYTELGWISEKVSNKILVYAGGIDYYEEKPTWKLMPEDHTKSLMFIERLCGRKIELTAIHKLKRDMDKVKHDSEQYFEI